MANPLPPKTAELTDTAILTMARSGIKSKVLDIFNKKFKAEYPEMWIGEGNADEIQLNQEMSFTIFPNWKAAFNSHEGWRGLVNKGKDGKGVIARIKLKVPGQLPTDFLNHESEYEPPFDDHHHFFISDTDFDIVKVYPYTIKTAPRLKWTNGSPKTASSVQWLNGSPDKTAGTEDINKMLTRIKSPGLEKMRENLAIPPKILVIPGVSDSRSMEMLREGVGFLGSGRHIGRKRWGNCEGIIVKVGPEDIIRRSKRESGDDVWSIEGTPETELLYAGTLCDAPEEIWNMKTGAKTASPVPPGEVGPLTQPPPSLYHGTHLPFAIYILEDDSIDEGTYWGKKNEPHGPRLTISEAVAWKFSTYGELGVFDSGVVFELDGSKLAKKYSLVEYHDTSYQGDSMGVEDEVCVLTPQIKPLNSFIKMIHVKLLAPEYVTEMDKYCVAEHEWEPGEFTKSYEKFLKHPKVRIQGGAQKTAKAPYKTQEFEGWTILIGRSAADNDILSMEVAQPNDFWMHTADYPGSHVVVRNPQNLSELPESVLQEAARAAVHNSRAKGQSGVGVVVGRAGDLSKPEGSAVGEIDISSYKTIKTAAVPTPAPSIWNIPSVLSEMYESSTEFWYRKIKGSDIESKYDLPRGLLKHLIEKESKGNPMAVSHRGARGLFQIMPARISGFKGDPFDPRQAAHHAAKTIKELRDKFGTYEKALAAYNWGEANLRQHGMENAPKETRKFIKFFKSKGLI